MGFSSLSENWMLFSLGHNYRLVWNKKEYCLLFFCLFCVKKLIFFVIKCCLWLIMLKFFWLFLCNFVFSLLASVSFKIFFLIFINFMLFLLIFGCVYFFVFRECFIGTHFFDFWSTKYFFTKFVVIFRFFIFKKFLNATTSFFSDSDAFFSECCENTFWLNRFL